MKIDITDIVNQEPAAEKPVSLLLLDDELVNLTLRATFLRKHGYLCLTASTYEEALELFDQIDIAVLDYHLGAGKFGSDVAALLRKSRPNVPIIILSSTLEHYFGGAEDMHLLKGHSSTEDLLEALQLLEAKRRGTPVVVDAPQFFYTRICHAIGPDVLIQFFDEKGTWVYCNEAAAEYLGRDRDWFPGRSIHAEMPRTLRDWQSIIIDVLSLHNTYIARSRKGLLNVSEDLTEDLTWSILAFPTTLHDGRPGVILTARLLTPALSPP
ncbi:response regulator [Granulicella arctica]|uniref:CheY-like chemotaxis protein n=1 Tax=Granulicella arctica TaxID=940613 RepID=A0A7Y9THL1_9BACT|nr:CheY-like chemotaxis protein [Granulicella arctica]